MKHLTVRNLPAELATALENERRTRGLSLNATVIQLLGTALGVNGNGKRSNGLAKFAGDWSEQEFQEFEKVIAETCERIDPEDWR